jgi:uncharacterized alkaline shock family protein YloU
VTGLAPQVGVRQLAGHNRISTQALSSVAKAAAAESFGVAPADVRVEWHDDGGLLALSLALPVSVPSLAAVRRDPQRVAATGGSIRERAIRAKAVILQKVTWLTGSQLSRVDIRVSGVRSGEGGRVR